MAQTATAPAEPILPMGHRPRGHPAGRQGAASRGRTTRSPLPAGAPYGAVLVNTDACTLCLSCVSLCPSGALGDNPDKPQLRFQEDACLQCGLYVSVCPENAITLKPQMDLTDGALNIPMLNEEEPFHCIECGTPFGVKSTIERIVAKLEGKHSMFACATSARS